MFGGCTNHCIEVSWLLSVWVFSKESRYPPSHRGKRSFVFYKFIPFFFFSFFLLHSSCLPHPPLHSLPSLIRPLFISQSNIFFYFLLLCTTYPPSSPHTYLPSLLSYTNYARKRKVRLLQLITFWKKRSSRLLISVLIPTLHTIFLTSFTLFLLYHIFSELNKNLPK